MSGEPARLLPDTDRLSGPAQQPAPSSTSAPELDQADERMLRRGAALGTMDQIARGEDPLTSIPRFGGPIPHQLEIERRFMFERERTQQLNEAVFANPESGWGQIKGFMDDVFKRYQERNSEQLIKKPANEQEAMKQAEQMQAITVDPNEIASIRQMAVKLDQQIKSIDPRASFWTHPRTRKYAAWLNREAGGTGYGYLSSGEQQLDIGVTGTAAMMGVEAIEGAADFGTNLMHGLWDLSRQAIASTGGGDIGQLTPTNYVEGADGKLYDNGGKVPSFMDSMTAVWAAATDKNIQQEVARMGRTRELEVASRNGFQTIALGASRIAGMGVGFGVPAGAAMKGGAALFGGLTNKGLHALGALKLGRGVEQSSRALKLVQVMGKGLGAAVGNGLAESAAYGRLDGYGQSFMHGMTMAPVLMTLGAMGRKAEWLAKNRAKMPDKVAQLVGAGLEGVGFGAMEAHFPDVLPSAWGFIKDPSDETWQTYAKNMAGFMMFSIASRGRSVNPADQGRRQFAEQVAAGTATPEQMQRAPTGDKEGLRTLGEASRRLREARTPQERDAARRELEQVETERNVREMGLEGPATREVEGTWADLQREQQAAREGYQGEAAAERRAELETADPRAKERKLSQEQFDTEMERLRGDLRAAESPEARQSKIREIRELEQRQAEPAADRVELGEGMGLEFREGQTGGEWVVRNESGDIVGAGAFTPKGRKAEIHNAEMREEHRNKGIYTKVRAELERRFPEGLESVHQEPAARRAAEKAAEVESPVDEMRGGDVGDPGEGERKPSMRKKLPESAKQEVWSFIEDTSRTDPVRKEILDKLIDGKLDTLSPEARAEYREVLKELANINNSNVRGGDGDARSRAALKVLQEELGKMSDPIADDIRRGEGRGPGGVRQGLGSGMIPPTRQVKPSEDATPMRASDIILEMQGRPGKKGFRIPFTAKRVGAKPGDPVRVTMRGGKIPGKGVLGYFAFYENIIRNKDARDLAVASHEWSHAMHRHAMGKGQAAYKKGQSAQLKSLPTEVVQEIMGVVEKYPGIEKMPANSVWAEVWAEWHARNLLGEVELDQKFPNLSKWMRSWLAKPEQAQLRPQYQRIQNMLHAYNVQGSLSRVRHSVVLDTDPETPSERVRKPSTARRVIDTVTKALFDDMIDLKRKQEEVLEMTGRKPEDVKIGEDPARTYDALRMTAGKTAEHFVMQGIRSPSGERIPGLREVLEPVRDNAEDFVTYVTARRNLDIYKQGKAVQLPPQDYAAAVKELEAKHPEFREAATNMKLWTDALVDYVARSGNLSSESAQRIKDAYGVYVPFFRKVEGPAKHGGGRGQAERGTGMAALKGSSMEIRDPLVALQEVATSMIAKAHQNQVMTALYKMAQGQEAGSLATVIPQGKVPKDHPIARLLDLIEKKIEIPEEMREQAGEAFDLLRSMNEFDPGIVTTFHNKVIPTGERSVVAFTPRMTEAEMASLESQGAHMPSLRDRNNRLIWMELDPKVYEAMMGIDKMPQMPEALQPVLRMMQAPRDLVRFFATGVSPGFVAANLIRDSLSQPLFSREGKFRPFGGFVNVIRGAIEYHKKGPMRELYDELGVSTSSFFTEGRQREIAGQNKTLRQKFMDWSSRVQGFFAHPENYLRISEFKSAYETAKKAGKSESDARLEALEAGKELMNFARAGIVSRALNQLIPYFNAGLVGKRKFYSQLLWGGDVQGDAAKARVQRATILNGLAQITAPTMALWFINKDEDWYQDLPDWRKVNYWNFKAGDEIVSIPKPFEAGVIFGTLPEIVLDHQLENARPAEMRAAAEVALGSYMEGIGNFIPAIIRPILEVTTNYDFFRGRQVTPEHIQKSMKPEDQSTFYTTATARILSKAINGVLTPIEIEQLLGGYTAGAATSGLRAMDEIAGLKDHPLGLPLPWQRFFRQTPHRQSAFVNDLYELSTDLNQRSDELSQREKSLRTQVNRAKSRIADLRKRSRSGQMSSEEAERQAYEIARPLVQQSRKP